MESQTEEKIHLLCVGWRNLPRFAWAGGTFFPDGKKNRFVITTGKKSSSRLSGGCVIVITTRKKSSSRLSGGCAITNISTTGPIYAKSFDFDAKLNVSNLNVTNLY